MPPPTAYTEHDLRTYMASILGDVAEALGWEEDNGKFDEAVNETLLAYGESDIAQATNILKLRAIARREAWKAAVGSLAAHYDFSSDQDRFQPSQMLKGAKDALAIAEIDCGVLGVGSYTATITPIRRTEDPYKWIPPSDGVA